MSEGFALNVASWLPRSVVSGPGERFVLWLQGCPFRCTGCINPDYLEFTPARRLTVARTRQLIASAPGVEGVTFSGGEPMAQARGLFGLSRALRREGLSVVCYSGYRLEDLRRHPDPWVGRFLSEIDLLIDGPYIAGEKANLPWRGSRNQRVHHLTRRYRHLGLDETPAGIEFTLGRDAFNVTGSYRPDFLARLQELLGERNS